MNGAATVETARAGRVTVIILNWQRPSNLEDHILPSLEGIDLISEIIIGSYAGAMPLRVGALGRKVTVVEASRDLGLDSRFALALLARTSVVLIQDDDLMLPEATIRTLYDGAKAQPDRLHGLFGRRPLPGNIYAEDVVQQDAEVDIVLTRALMTVRPHFALFFEARDVPEIARARARAREFSTHPENGEDIILNYAVGNYHGLLHRVHEGSVVELPRMGVGISQDMTSHKRFRTLIMQACQQTLPSASSTG